MLRGYRNGYVAKVYRASGTHFLTTPSPVTVASLPMRPVADGSAVAALPVTVDVAATVASPPAPPAWDVFA